uniref:Uncharacterized protein n=1 Tax=Molossus molossus TaxID=27622 RepID=A0A7J8F9H3_MOLMO|nr:hypothetical protein HJG59_008576 [Molossus molossus]
MCSGEDKKKSVHCVHNPGRNIRERGGESVRLELRGREEVTGRQDGQEAGAGCRARTQDRPGQKSRKNSCPLSGRKEDSHEIGPLKSTATPQNPTSWQEAPSCPCHGKHCGPRVGPDASSREEQPGQHQRAQATVGWMTTEFDCEEERKAGGRAEEGGERKRGRKETVTLFRLTVWNTMPGVLGTFTYLILKPPLQGGVIPAVERKSQSL